MKPGTDRRILKTVLAALVFVLGFQSLRFLFGSIAWYLRDTLHVGTLELVPIALGPFILGAVFPILSRWMGAKGALWSAIWLLTFARTLNQIAGDPAVDFWMAAGATMAFVGALPLLLGFGRSALVGGLLLGVALDSAIKGLSLSLDLAHQPGLVPVLVVASTGLAALYLMSLSGPLDSKGVGWGSGSLLISIGPFLFIQFLILQNQGWLAEMIGMPAHEVPLRVALLNALALFIVGRYEHVRWLGWLSAAVLVAAVLVAEGDPGAFNTLSLVAIPAAAVVWARLVPSPDREGLAASGFHLTLGMTVFVILGLAYYLPLDLSLPFDSAGVRVFVAVVLGVVAAIVAARPVAREEGMSPATWAFAGLAAALPLVTLLVGAGDDAIEGHADGTLRVMTYNVHSAFDTTGVLDVEAIARVIEDSGAEVVGLQEIPRGRLISGSTDLFALLQSRLGFEYAAYFGTTDPVWGNAILSRFPIEGVGKEYLPKVDTPMQRGYLGADILAENQRIRFISTHLQHVNDPEVHDDDPEADLYPVHHEQIATILEEWGGVHPAVMVGDFNARPDWRQVGEILAAGWLDSWAEVGVGDGFTAHAADPQYRIDYVFHTGDLIATDAGVIPTQASDHFPVVVDLE